MFEINEKSNYFTDEKSESPIERLFLEEIVKYLEIGTQIEQQLEYKTKIGNFRIDFKIKNDAEEFAVELDGKKFHNVANDIWRDAFLLGEGKIKSIVRIKGKDATYSLNECIYFLSKIYPKSFSERGKINISTLIEPVNKNVIDENIEKKEFSIIDKFYIRKIEIEDEEIKTFPSIEIALKNNSDFKYWKEHYDFALKNNIFEIEELKRRFYKT